MYKKLRKQLSNLGINKAQAENMRTEGYPAVMLRWNGQEEIFTGYNNMDDPRDVEAIEARINRFKDKNLS